MQNVNFTCSFTWVWNLVLLQEERRWKMFGCMRGKVTAAWRKRHSLMRSFTVGSVRCHEPRWLRWVRHLAQRGEVWIAYIILIGGVLCRDIINMEPKGTYFVCVNCILLIHDNVYLTGLAGRSGFRVPSSANDFSSPKRPDRPCGLGVVSWPGREADHHHHLASRLRMSGVTPLFPLCAFAGWTGRNLLLPSVDGLFRTRIWTCSFHGRPGIYCLV